MKLFLSIILTVNYFIGIPSFAQTISFGELNARGEFNHGYHPKSLESLVGSASIIVKGRYERFVKNELFYGYDSTQEEFQKKYGLSDLETQQDGLPISSYVINVHEVFLGDESLQGKEIIYRIGESQQISKNEFVNFENEILFFLGRNPDDTFAPLGEVSVQISRNGIYSYDSLAPYPDQFVGKTLDFVDSVAVDDLEQLIRVEISKQYSPRNFTIPQTTPNDN